MAFSHLLYQPSCDWCQKYKDNHTETNWPFPDESAKVIDSDRCHYNFSDFQADKQRCQVAYDFAKSGEKDTPPVWKVCCYVFAVLPALNYNSQFHSCRCLRAR